MTTHYVRYPQGLAEAACGVSLRTDPTQLLTRIVTVTDCMKCLRKLAERGAQCPDDTEEAIKKAHGAEKLVSAVYAALEIEGWVIKRGEFDKGIQLACQRVREALKHPDDFLDPKPAVAND